MAGKLLSQGIKVKMVLSKTRNIFLICCVFLLIGGVCLAGQLKENLDFPRYNVVVILLDALRADHLSCYGYFRKTSPNIDRLTKEAVLFENCISQCWYTLPSISSLFTSKYAHTHHVTEKNNRLADSEITLAEILKLYGYKTAAFTGGIFFDPVYGLNQGFDTYYAKAAESQGRFPFRLGKSDEIYPKALNWIENNKNNDFFIFIHSYDLFLPCRLPEEYNHVFSQQYEGPADELLGLRRLHLSRLTEGNYLVGKRKESGKKVKLEPPDIQHIIDNYDAGILFSDHFVGVLLDKIKELDLDRKTILILVADHGTDLLGHDSLHLYMDGNPYDEVLKVPLIIKYPGLNGKNRKVKSQVQLIDIMPTVLDFLNIPINREEEGRSVFSLLKNGDTEGFNENVFSGWDNLLIVRNRSWKLIYSKGSYELYDLKKDPKESVDLSVRNPDIFMKLVKPLFSWSVTAKSGDLDNTIELSGDLSDKLKKAGYW